MTRSLNGHGAAHGHEAAADRRDEATVGRERITFELTTEQTEGELAVFRVTIPPGGGPPMLHRHDPFELYRVHSGILAVYIEGKDGAVTRRVVGPGTVVPIDGGLEHTIRNESDREAEAVVVFSPGEPMERFARAAGRLGGDRKQSQDDVLALAQAHRIEITRPIEDALTDTGGERPPAAGAAYLTIARFSGDGDQLLAEYRKYSGVMSEVGRDHGLIVHAAAGTDSGFLVVNLWPSKGASEAAARDPRRLDVIEEARITPDQIHREHHDVFHLGGLGLGALAAGVCAREPK